MHTTADTKLLGVFGYPVGHTLSPKLHSILAEKTNKDAIYLAFLASPDEFGEKVNALKSIGALGFNITIPHKISVMKYMDVVDDFARLAGAVNTAVNKGGVWHGYNTDGDGFLKSLKINNVDVKGKNILILGAGGSARSIALSLSLAGAKSITITARTMEKALLIGDLIEKHSDCKFESLYNDSFEYDIYINTTPLGMKPLESENPLKNLEKITEKTVCCDLIYSPWETNFLRESKKRGAKIINGLPMLVFQGIYSFEHFFDEKYDDAFFEDVYNTFSQKLGK